MTTRPRLFTSRDQVWGVLAIALFGVMAAAFVTAEFGESVGFEGGSTTETIGYALLNLEGSLPTEGFLVALIIMAVVLDAALDAAVMLGKREESEDRAAPDGGAETRAPGGPDGRDVGRDRGGDR
jgi:NADH-quinone oxidoreductase subunit J